MIKAHLNSLKALPVYNVDEQVLVTIRSSDGFARLLARTPHRT